MWPRTLWCAALIASGCASGTPAPAEVPDRAPPRARPVYELPHLPGADARPWVDPEPFRVGDLPIARFPEPIPPSEATPEAYDAGRRPLDLVLEHGARRPRFGSPLAAGPVDLRVLVPVHAIDVDAGGRHLECEAGAEAMVPLRWWTLRADLSADAELAATDGIFHAGRCEVAMVRRTALRPRRLSGGIFHAFREQDPGNRTRAVLTILLPPAIVIVDVLPPGRAVIRDRGTFTSVSVPLGRGAGASIVAELPTGDLDAWLGGHARAAWGRRTLRAGVEVAQGEGDAEPVAMSYAEASPF